MKTNLFKEAIADADAIKKMAIENAKASLNEAFDTKIKSMLAARLEEEAEDLELEEEYEEEDEAYVKKGKKEETDEAAEEEDESYIKEKKHAEPDSDNKGGESDDDADNMGDEDEGFNLDEIIAELEKGEEEETDEAAYEEEDEAYAKNGGEEETDEAAEEEDEAYHGKEEMDEEINIEALLAEMEDEDEEKPEEPKKDEDDEEKDEVAVLEEEMMSLLEKMKMAKKAKAKKMEKKSPEEELQEMKRQAAELTQKVNETNLINAKLLFLNKILRKYNLSEQQKLKVIGAFDKATTTKEAKIVHESLDQAFSVKNDNVKSNLKESIGFASKAAGTSTKRVITEGVISDADKQVSRWQKLAGIIK